MRSVPPTRFLSLLGVAAALVAAGATTAGAQSAPCSNAAVVAAFGGLVKPHPTGAPVLSNNANLCAFFANHPNHDLKCTNFGAAHGLVDVELAFFVNDDATGTYCGCVCAGDGAESCLPRDELEDAITTELVPGEHPYTVSDSADIVVGPADGYVSCDQIQWSDCIKLNFALGQSYVASELEIDGERFCGCVCDPCAAFSTAEVLGASEYDDLDAGEGRWAVVNPIQLESISQDPLALGQHYLQCRDMDMLTLYRAPTDEDAGHPYFAIGTSEEPFSGIYDGQGFAVANYTYRVDGPAFGAPGLTRDIGLFGHVLEGTIQRLELPGVDVFTEDTDSTAGLVGTSGHADIVDVHATGTVHVQGDGVAAGGLIGHALDSSVLGCSAELVVTAWSVIGVGGLVGETEATDVARSHTAGSAVANTIAGGLVGLLGGTSTIVDSFSVADVSGFADVGGLAGRIEDSDLVRVYFGGAVDAAVGTGAAAGGGLGGTMHGVCDLAHSFVRPVSLVGANPFVGVVVPHLSIFISWPPGATATDVSYWDSLAFCAGGCNDHPSTTGLQFGSLFEATQHFSQPMPTWDYNEVWQLVPDALPTLRPLEL